MARLCAVYLKKGKEIALERKHPWVFSGAIARTSGNPADGDLVDIFQANGDWLCCGHFHHGSIAVRILSWFQDDAPEELQFWVKRMQLAYQLRLLTLVSNKATDCFRLVHGEGDQLSGLIVDVYGKTAIVQCHSIGMFKHRQQIAEAILVACAGSVSAIYDKSKESLPKQFAAQTENGYLVGNQEDRVVLENGNRFKIDWQEGQKTGFFLDQRDNRKLLGSLASGKSVLNTFCYSGGFSVYALAGGARLVRSVDVSAKAMALTDENIELNRPFDGTHESICADVLAFFKTHDQSYDIVVVDPPAFAKTLDKRHNAVQGYKRLNIAALRLVEPGGLLFTFSCSQVIERELFQNTIVAALLESGRSAQVLYTLSQGPDHPVFGFHPEGHYLKGLVLRVL